MDEAFLGAMLASTLRVSTPLIFCALAGLLAEQLLNLCTQAAAQLINPEIYIQAVLGGLP